MDREQAYEILKKHIASDSLRKHCIAVEVVMRHFAKIQGEDIEKWGIIGMLHDIDYEKYPEEHCVKCVDILQEENIPIEWIHSIQSHGYGMTDSPIEPTHPMEKILYTIDELTGLINAAALMQPNKTVAEVKLSSLRKKFKSPSFAAKIDREVIKRGAQMAGMELDYTMEESLKAMQDAHEILGL